MFYRDVAEKLWQRAGCRPADVDVLQLYENFTGPVLMAICEMGFAEPGEVEAFVRRGLAGPDAELPINTSGGNLGEAYIHGFELVNEAVRQVRGDSTCQVTASASSGASPWRAPATRPAAPCCSGRRDENGDRGGRGACWSGGRAPQETSRDGLVPIDPRQCTVSRFLGDDWLLPALDAKNQAWFTSGVLALQACTRCHVVQFPPEDACRSCGSFELGVRASAGRGRVESVAVVHHAVHPLLRPSVPYAVALVSLEDAPHVRLLGNVLNRAHDEVAIGDRVRVVFEVVSDPESGETLRIPQWQAVT